MTLRFGYHTGRGTNTIVNVTGWGRGYGSIADQDVVMFNTVKGFYNPSNDTIVMPRKEFEKEFEYVVQKEWSEFDQVPQAT